MKARELAAPYPSVRLNTNGLDAARVLMEKGRPALLVVDEYEHPVAILPASQVLRFMIPRYVQDDPTLAGVLDEEFADHICDALADKTVEQLLPDRKNRTPLTVVEPDDTVVEIAAKMAANRSPLVAVVEGAGKTARVTGAITVSQLVSALIPDRVKDA